AAVATDEEPKVLAVAEPSDGEPLESST
ncbi:MAG: hypothetical protein QOC92_1219, partial [Acidimicrobiaceae bacterium]